jgi:hypothetical protein
MDDIIPWKYPSMPGRTKASRLGREKRQAGNNPRRCIWKGWNKQEAETKHRRAASLKKKTVSQTHRFPMRDHPAPAVSTELFCDHVNCAKDNEGSDWEDRGSRTQVNHFFWPIKHLRVF